MKERYEIRVEEEGLIEILEDNVTVVWGLHNTICQRLKVKRGYLFNSIGMVGSWYDVVPENKQAGVVYFRRIGDCIPHTEIDLHNSELN